MELELFAKLFGEYGVGALGWLAAVFFYMQSKGDKEILIKTIARNTEALTELSTLLKGMSNAGTR